MQRNQFGIDIPEQLITEQAKYKPQVTKWDYCKVDVFGLVTDVFCKCCGVRVMGARAWGDPEVTRAKDDKGTMVVRQNVRIMPYDNYSMSILRMEDGSRHLTVTCKPCALKLEHMSADQLLALYICDMHSLAETATSARDIEVVAKLHTRKPVEVM